MMRKKKNSLYEQANPIKKTGTRGETMRPLMGKSQGGWGPRFDLD